MFTTQYTAKRARPEPNNGISLVSNVQVKPNSVKILDAIMAGSMIEARNVGYDFREGDKLPDLISAYNTRSMDIVDRLQVVHDVRNCIETYIQTAAAQKREEATKPTEQFNPPADRTQPKAGDTVGN